jgi:hypothetical protein
VSHSPGPWTASRHAGNNEISASDGTVVCKSYGWSDDDCAANAVLIASAPTLLAERDELLAALRHAAACPYEDCVECTGYVALIARIEGGLSRAPTQPVPPPSDTPACSPDPKT